MAGLQRWIESGFLAADTAARLERFASLLHVWNPKVNLTGFKRLDEILDLLVGESVAALAALKLKECSVLDFGSGAGIPGLVWAMCEPSLRVTSLEIRQKKVAFQKEAARQLGLGVEVLPGHFPEAVAGRRFDCIVSRAIRFRAPVWQQAEQLLSGGGMFVRFSGVGTVDPGWRSLPVSARTVLLVRH